MKNLRRFLTNLTLSQRFMLASLVILLAGMAGIGSWVEQQIVAGVIRRTGVTTALYVGSFVSPRVQEIGTSEDLLPANSAALSDLLSNTAMNKQIVAIKVWNTRGKLVYSSDPTKVGKTFPMHESMLRARLGEVVTTISQLDDEENKDLGVNYKQLLETYSPVWLSGTDRVIAVAEFYQQTGDLEQELAVMKMRTWLVVGLAILVIYLLLAGFVGRASDTIQRQKTDLGQKVIQLTGLLEQNSELNERVRRASASVAQLNESYLKRIGSELHDGPAQDLGLSILKLDALAGRLEQDNMESDVVPHLNEVGASLQNALKEMRGIAAGLSLPQLVELDLAETVVRVVRAHERRTGTSVDLDIQPLPDGAPLPLRITVYRVIQEALNNAYQHGGGVGQRVRVSSQDNQLLLIISDSGPGFVELQTVSSGRLGLSGMRERVESLGGLYKIDSRPGQGTTILARLPFQIEGGTSL